MSISAGYGKPRVLVKQLQAVNGDSCIKQHQYRGNEEGRVDLDGCSLLYEESPRVIVEIRDGVVSKSCNY